MDRCSAMIPSLPPPLPPAARPQTPTQAVSEQTFNTYVAVAAVCSAIVGALTAGLAVYFWARPAAGYGSSSGGIGGGAAYRKQDEVLLRSDIDDSGAEETLQGRV